MSEFPYLVLTECKLLKKNEKRPFKNRLLNLYKSNRFLKNQI